MPPLPTHSPDDTARAGELHGDEPQPGFLANLVTLVLLVMLQAVLGFDNLLYISLESGRAPKDKQKMVRMWGIGLAIFFRIGLLLILLQLISVFQHELFALPASLGSFAEGSFNGHSLIVLAGGVFILYTATKEVWHMMKIDEHGHHEEKKPKSVFMVIFWIVLMNVVFSFDSILSAMALTHVFWVMATAIIIGGILMIALADTISVFPSEESHVRGAWSVHFVYRWSHVGQRRWPLGTSQILRKRRDANDQDHVLLRDWRSGSGRYRAGAISKKAVGAESSQRCWARIVCYHGGSLDLAQRKSPDFRPGRSFESLF